MKTWLPLALVFVLAAVGCQVLAMDRVVMCYFTNWSQYRSRKFFPENIDPYMCTHIVYSFAKLQNNKLTTFEWNDAALYKRMMDLKMKNPSLKVLLAVGGYNAGSREFSAMSSTAQNRQEFVFTTISWLRRYGFDGLDVDWEYPGFADQGGTPEDKANFALLLQDLREGFNKEGRVSGQGTLLLTSAVAAGYSKVAGGYDIMAINKYLDLIGIMSYDLHGAWDNITGHNSALYTSSTDKENYSVASVAEYWYRGGASRSKTLIGLATYGRTWTLQTPSQHSVGAPARGAGNAGKYTNNKGTLSYYEICEQLQTGYTKAFDDQSKTPYAYKGNQWISYDDVNSLQHKMNWLINQGYGGVIIWSLDLDDFDGSSCGQGRYPLFNAINNCIKNNRNCVPAGGSGPVAPQTNRPTVTQAPVWPTRAPVVSGYKCIKNGKFADPYDCSRFYFCYMGQQWYYNCPSRTSFDEVTGTCGWVCRKNNAPQH